MTNHIHLIIGSQKDPLAGIMRDLKKFTSSKILKAIEGNIQESRREWLLWMFERAGKRNVNNKKYQFWQQHNQPIELNSPEIAQQKLDYLHQNPVEAGFSSEPEEYWYSSARDYAGKKGLLDVLFLFG